mgnify:CR=1
MLKQYPQLYNNTIGGIVYYLPVFRVYSMDFKITLLLFFYISHNRSPLFFNLFINRYNG